MYNYSKKKINEILQLVQIEVIFRNNVKFVTGHTNYCTKLFTAQVNKRNNHLRQQYS